VLHVQGIGHGLQNLSISPQTGQFFKNNLFQEKWLVHQEFGWFYEVALRPNFLLRS